jgi:hypothetical protein
MAGELKFTLGLVTGGFLSQLGGVDSKVKGFIGSMVSMGAITAGVMHAIETGAGLEHLHKRTGESVGDLVKLQSGFKAAGLSAEDVGATLFFMQKSLGGINEFGQGTANTFNRMGLSMGKLKSMGAPQALAAILGSMKQMNQSDAVKAASVIFGRGESGNMLQLARSSGEFAEGMAKAAAKAAIFQDNSAAFAKLLVTMDQIKGKATVLFAGIAAGLAPALQNVEDMLNGVDLSGIGTSIGKYLTALTQAFREGSLSDLIAETFKVGLEGAVIFALPILERLGMIILKVFETPLTYLQAGWDYIIGQMMGKMIALRRVLHLEATGQFDQGAQAAQLAAIERQHKSGKLSDSEYEKRKKEATTPEQLTPDSWGVSLQKRKETGVEFGQQGFGFKEMDEQAATDMTAAKAKFADIKKGFVDMVNGLASRAPKGPKSENVKKGGSGMAATGNYTPQFTEIEKMGFVMSRLGNPNAGPADRTANATERMAALMEEQVNGPETGPAAHEA